MPWGAAAIAASSVVGAIAGGSSKTGTQTQETKTAPWATQQPYLERAFRDAQGNYQGALDRGTYTGSMIASPTAQTQQGIDYLTNYSNGQGGALANQVAGASTGLLTALPQYQSNAAALAANGVGPLNSTAQGTLIRAASGQPVATMSGQGVAGQTAQGSALSNAQGILAGTQGDTDAALRTAAQGYVDGGVVQGTVDNALRDVSRTLGEQTLPGLNARAVAGGNLNSARAGAAEAVARRGAEDRAADVAAGIRQDAYNTGLSTALANRTQNAATALGANSQLGTLGTAMANTGEQGRQFDTTATLGAAQNLGALDIQNRQLDAETRLSANQQLGQAGQLGIAGAQAASGLVDANGQRLLTAGQVQQQADQQGLDADYERWNREYAQKQGLLRDFYGVVGAQNWGSQSTSTTTGTTPGNPVGGALGGAAMGMGLYNAAGGSKGIGSAFSGLFGSGSSAAAAPTYAGLY